MRSFISYFSIDVIEEEEAFQAYAEQRRYAATLARSGLNSGSNRSSRRGAETDRGLKGNISRFVSSIFVQSEIWNIQSITNIKNILFLESRSDSLY